MDILIDDFKNNVKWLDNKEHNDKTKSIFNIYCNIIIYMEKFNDKINRFDIKPKYNYYIKKHKLISKNVYDFLNLDIDCKLTKTEIIREFHKYIMINNLRDNVDVFKINFDEKLKLFLNIEKDFQLNYFNLQYHIFKDTNFKKI